MSAEHFDSIIVGSGAGGAAAAHRLTEGGQRVLLLEKGPALARTSDTLDPQRVVHDGYYKSKEIWSDARGNSVVPEEYFNVGGKTKWYGAALLRFARNEMISDPLSGYLDWPVGEAALDPYYAAAEQLLGVRTFPCEPTLERIVRILSTRAGWTAFPLPMGLSPRIVDTPDEAAHFDGFASPTGMKSDAEYSLIDRARATGRLTLLTNEPVVDLLPDNAGRLTIAGVRTANGAGYRASRVLLAAGALHSPRLLERYLRAHTLDSLPIAANVGRNLKLHLLTAMVSVSTTTTTDQLRKTTALTHSAFPHSSVQPLGFDGELIASLVPKLVPRWIARHLGNHAYGFFLQTEDSSHRDNRVYTNPAGRPVLDYDPTRSPVALNEHRRFTARLGRALLGAGYVSFIQPIGVTGTAHACGTLVAGRDPSTSVVAEDGRVHGLSGLYVVDGSVLPRSSRVNPSLTIYAWSLRVAEQILGRQGVAAAGAAA